MLDTVVVYLQKGPAVNDLENRFPPAPPPPPAVAYLASEFYLGWSIDLVYESSRVREDAVGQSGCLGTRPLSIGRSEVREMFIQETDRS